MVRGEIDRGRGASPEAQGPKTGIEFREIISQNWYCEPLAYAPEEGRLGKKYPHKISLGEERPETEQVLAHVQRHFEQVVNAGWPTTTLYTLYGFQTYCGIQGTALVNGQEARFLMPKTQDSGIYYIDGQVHTLKQAARYYAFDIKDKNSNLGRLYDFITQENLDLPEAEMITKIVHVNNGWFPFRSIDKIIKSNPQGQAA